MTVRDAEGRLVTGLGRDDFKVFEDGREQPLSDLSLRQVPVDVALLVDSSSSVAESFEDFRRAAEEFAGRVSTDDRFCLVKFDDRVELLLDWSKSRLQLRRALEPTLDRRLHALQRRAAARRARAVPEERAAPRARRPERRHRQQPRLGHRRRGAARAAGDAGRPSTPSPTPRSSARARRPSWTTCLTATTPPCASTSSASATCARACACSTRASENLGATDARDRREALPPAELPLARKRLRRDRRRAAPPVRALLHADVARARRPLPPRARRGGGARLRSLHARRLLRAGEERSAVGKPLPPAACSQRLTPSDRLVYNGRVSQADSFKHDALTATPQRTTIMATTAMRARRVWGDS